MPKSTNVNDREATVKVSKKFLEKLMTETLFNLKPAFADLFLNLKFISFYQYGN